MGFINIPVHKIDNAFVFQCGMVVDADGAANAYRLDDQGLDYVKDAQNDAGEWVGAITVDGNPKSKPVIQGPNDPSPGSLVSPTSLHDPAFDVKDPRRYVDATIVPYLAISPDFEAMGVKLGDLAVVVRKDMVVGLICADICPHHHFGECSCAAAPGVNLSGSPRDGGTDSGCTYVVFSNTAANPPWLRNVVEFQQAALDAFDAWGGITRLRTLQLVA